MPWPRLRRSDALPWLGKSRGGLRRFSEWLGAVLRIGEYLPSRRGTTGVFGRARGHLSLRAAVAAWRAFGARGRPRAVLPGLNKTRARVLGLDGAHAEFGFVEWQEVLLGQAGRGP